MAEPTPIHHLAPRAKAAIAPRPGVRRLARRSAAVLAVAVSCLAAPVQGHGAPEPTWRLGDVLHEDVIEPGLASWRVEMEKAGVVEAADGALRIDVPLGATVWFEPELKAPLRISYTVTPVAAGGPNDEVSDVNCFWMATDPRGDFFDVEQRTGKFSTYHELRCYYAGIGGGRNTTTRFRRYIGDPDVRPLLPQHDLGAGHLLEPNTPVHIELIVLGGLVQLRRDGDLLFELHDENPYHRGRFGLRTVKNHMVVTDFRVHEIIDG